MPPQIATLIFAIGIACLFYFDRHDSERPSKALWLPIIWLGISGSRSLSAWLGMSMPAEIPGQLPESSPLDQLFAATLMLLGAIVLIRRKRLVTGLLKGSWPILLYFAYCLFSLLWSDFPAWGFKRWIRSLGDLIMVLVVATDAHPIMAFRRVLSRLGFVLLPTSVLLIKYYPELGTGYDLWGLQQLTGVTTNKNVLGNLAFVLGLGALWQILHLIMIKKQPNRARHLLAQGTTFAFGIQLLFTAHCATAVGSCVVGAAFLLVISLPRIRRRPAGVHALVLALLLAGALTELLGGRAAITEALGRKPDLTGRTEIWSILIPMVPNPIGGAGFETFWCGPRVAKAFAKIGGIHMTNESHNGYIEVYLNLGWLGLGLIALILGHGYRRAVMAFRCDSALGALLTAYVLTAATYSLSEAAFRMLGLEWLFLLMPIILASRIIRLSESALMPSQELAAHHLGRLEPLNMNPTWSA